MTDIYGIKVSKPGKDISSTDPNDFVLNSEWGTIKFLKWGLGSKTVGASTNATETISYDWSGGRPLVALYVELTPNSGKWYFAPFSTAQIGTEDTYISESVDDTSVGSTSMSFKIVNTTASEKTVSYYYFIIGETGK